MYLELYDFQIYYKINANNSFARADMCCVLHCIKIHITVRRLN